MYNQLPLVLLHHKIYFSHSNIFLKIYPKFKGFEQVSNYETYNTKLCSINILAFVKSSATY